MRLFFTSLLVMFGTVECAIGAIVYSQVTPDVPHAAFASNDSFTTSQRVADNFSLSGSDPTNIRSLRFIGGDGLLIPMPDVLRVAFLEDAGGVPGSILSGGDFRIGTAHSSRPTRGLLLNGVTTPREYIINLPGGMLLNPDTPYWLSITNNLLPASGWGWARADGVLDQTLVSTFDIETGPWNAFTSGGMWFELYDHNIPEPSSLLLIITASLACVIQRKSRRE